MIFGRSNDDIYAMKSDRHPSLPWYYGVDWALVGYIFFFLGSLFYLIQSLGYYISIEPDPGLSGLIASVIFIVESNIYVWGWFIGRSLLRLNGIEPIVWYADWNLWGNWLFWIGSWGYLFTDTAYYNNDYQEQSRYLSIALSILFIFDSLFYTFACFDGETSRAPAHLEFSLTFDSSFDWYLAACVLFIVGSILYFVAAVQDYYGVDTSFLYFVAAVNFIIDSMLYIVSVFHRRDPDFDVPITRRGWYWFSVYGAECTSARSRGNKNKYNRLIN